MTAEFLVLANIWLLTRLPGHFRSDPAPARFWWYKAGIELAALVLLYAWSWGGAMAMAAVVLLNFAGFRVERGLQPRNFGRLAIGLGGLLVFSFCLGPAARVEFRPAIVASAASLAGISSFHGLWLVAAQPRFLLTLLGLLLCANESNLIIRAVFDWLDLKPRVSPASGGVVDVGEFNRGRVIGLLERALLYSFVLQSQYGAIGFVLAAKAFTRFKALDDRPFAEYVLIGTLLSAGLALAVGTGVRAWLLR